MGLAFIHPAILYGRWKDWDGTPVVERPLFYQGLSEDDAKHLIALSDESISIARAITRARPEVALDHVKGVESWLLRSYSDTIGDPSSVHTMLKTNSAFEGLLHPMREVSQGQWVPDFTYRYLSEDVPWGLAVVKGVAQVLGVATPLTDRLIVWAQRHLAKEFLVQGSDRLEGKDVARGTRAPQAFGRNTLEDLLAIV